MNWAKEIRDVNWFISGSLVGLWVATDIIWFFPIMIVQHVVMSFIEGFLKERQKILGE